jgi:asparagine synthase (glutamine-hydrolysing)
MNQYIERVIDLTDPHLNRIANMDLEEARRAVSSGSTEAVRRIEGSFALVAKEAKTVRLARSLDRPMRYFLAKRQDGPALVVADRIDRIAAWLKQEGFADQFHPSYTRMVPAHFIVEIQLIGCPDPDPTYTRFFDPPRNVLPADLDEIGRRYIGAMADSVAAWLRSLPAEAPVGIAFSGGIDSGAVFLVTYHVMRKLGMNLGRLKAFTLDLGHGPDLAQAKEFLNSLGLGLFLEPIEAAPGSLDAQEAIRVVEDYKPLDIEAATMLLQLCRGIRDRYPDWRHMLDGDGGDENLKDYPIHENPELTIRSVLNNLMLYQEGWGVKTIKHSLTYSGGLSRSYTRTYASLRHFGFEGFSPFVQPNVVEVAEGIPFIDLTQWQCDDLYALKGRIVSRGVRAITGMEMPVNAKRRFQHGALPEESLRRFVPGSEQYLRGQFLALYA